MGHKIIILNPTYPLGLFLTESEIRKSDEAILQICKTLDLLFYLLQRSASSHAHLSLSAGGSLSVSLQVGLSRYGFLSQSIVAVLSCIFFG